MHDTGTVFSSHKVARDYTESALAGIYPRQQLLILHAGQVAALVFGYDFPGDEFVARLVGVELQVGSLGVEERGHEYLCHNHADGRTGIGIVCLYQIIVDIGTYAQRRVGGQSPRRRGPCQEIGLTESRHLGTRIANLELCDTGCILHIAVATGLVELVRAEAGTGSRRIGLNGVSLVEVVFVVELLEQPPQRLDITVVVGDVGVLHIYPVTHTVREVFPLAGKLHHIFAAGSVVVGHRNGLTDVFLGNAQRLFHTQLYGQTVGIPTGLTHHLKSLHGLVTAENILDGASHYVVNTRHTVGRGGTLVEYKRRTTFAGFQTLMKKILLIPLIQNLLVDFREVEMRIFGEFLAHIFLK